MRNPPEPAALRREHGFTLPELLVAMVITLIVTGAAFTALQDATRASEAGAVMTDVNQNLRVGMNLVIRDLLQTGEGIPTGGIPIPSGAGAQPGGRPGPEGADWEFDAAWVVLPAISPGDDIGPIVAGVSTDAVTLMFRDHRLDLSTAPLATVDADGSSVTFPGSIDISDDALGVHQGDLILFTNAKGNALQEVTGVDGQVAQFEGTAGSRLNQPGAEGGSIVALRNEDGTWPPTIAQRVVMVSYYLHVPDAGPITSPHLIRRINYGEERAVAVGIENIQLTWDLVDGVTNPTNVGDPGPTAADPDNENTEHQIRKANLYVAARSLATYSRTGQFLRSSLVTQVSLRSLAFVSRYDIE